MSAWIVRPRARPAAALRLFCFPYAGGGAGVYRAWADALPETIELCAIQAPGREGRVREAPLADFRTVIAQAAAAIAPLLNRPYAFFGHSLGAIVSLEVARTLAADGYPEPLVLIASASRAPSERTPSDPISELPDREFLEGIRRVSGPDAAFDEFCTHPELVELLLPVLRADFTLSERYRPLSDSTLHCPVVAISPHGDTHAPEQLVTPWRDVTSGPFALHRFEGGHLYLNHRRAELVDFVVRELREHTAEGTGVRS